MKKTLIALVALSGLAMAENTSMLTFNEGFSAYSDLSRENIMSSNGNIGFDSAKVGDTTLTDYILTFQFSTLGTIGEADGIIRVNANNGLCVRGGTSGANELIFVKKHTGTTNLADNGDKLTVNKDDTIALTVSDTYGVAYLSNITTGDYITLSNLTAEFTNSADYSFKDNSADNSSTTYFYTHGGAQQFLFGQVANLEGLSSERVLTAATTGVVAPEPATATLSLLALAGLAARRRRH